MAPARAVSNTTLMCGRGPLNITDTKNDNDEEEETVLFRHRTKQRIWNAKLLNRMWRETMHAATSVNHSAMLEVYSCQVKRRVS